MTTERLEKSGSKAKYLRNTKNLQEEREKIREHVLDFAQRIRDGEVDSLDFGRHLPSKVSFKDNAEGAWTQTYRAILDVAREHPELSPELSSMQNMVAQEPQMMHPAHLIDIAAGAIWDPRINEGLKSMMLGWLGYTLRFMESPEYEKALTQKLDFTNTANFTKTAHFLEFMQSLYNVGDEFSYGGEKIVISRVHAALESAVSQGSGSYLLNIRARELLAQMDGREYVWGDSDRAPFLISKVRYAWHKTDGLYVTGLDNHEQIKTRIQEYLALSKSAMTNARIRELQMRHKELADLFKKKLTYGELVRGNEEDSKSPEEELIEEHDFGYLMQKPVREIIERDFEIKLSNLSLQDQYKLLKVLKEIPVDNATPLLLETTRALWKLKVKDYLGEIQGGALEQVAGNTVSESDGQTMRDMLTARYSKKYPEGERRALKDGITRALKDPNTRFYLYRKDGELVTYVRFSGDDEKRMASFITKPKFDGGAIGQALLQVALQKELETSKSIHAVCDPELGPFYARFGFKIERKYKNEFGVNSCDIILEAR